MTDPTLHSDLRASSVAPRRAHAQAEKWKHTTQTIPVHWTSSTSNPSTAISTPIPRPHKQPRIARGPIPSRGTALAHAWMECADTSCAHGEGELEVMYDGVLLPPGVPRGDEAVFYTYDSEASPASSVGLDGLVEKAERHFAERETERIVRKEYEVLDGEGETVRRRKGKSVDGGEGDGEVVDGEVGGAWEAI